MGQSIGRVMCVLDELGHCCICVGSKRKKYLSVGFIRRRLLDFITTEEKERREKERKESCKCSLGLHFHLIAFLFLRFEKVQGASGNCCTNVSVSEGVLHLEFPYRSKKDCCQWRCSFAPFFYVITPPLISLLPVSPLCLHFHSVDSSWWCGVVLPSDYCAAVSMS